MTDRQAEHAPEASVYFRAANGDHDAQDDIAQLIVERGVSGELPLGAAISWALIWAHMAATSGKARHLLGLAGLLMAQISQATDEAVGAGEYDDDFATALAIVDAVADAGHSRAEVIAVALASRVSPAIIAKASTLKLHFMVEPLTDHDRVEYDEGLFGMVEALRVDAMGAC